MSNPRPQIAGSVRGLAGALAGALAASALLLALSGCEDINWPFHRAHRAAAPVRADNAGGDNAAECADVLAQIKDNEEMRRVAPSTSVNPDIVSAADGKAEKRIDDLRQRYDALNCPAQAPSRPVRQPPLQPAPGAFSR